MRLSIFEVPITVTHPGPLTDSAAPTPSAPAPGRRPEIQGLRGLAIVLVVAVHLWGHGVSGGVDVFFVVSAYLLTASFARRVERGAPLGLLRYWSRTFVRLLIPVGIVVLSVLAVALAVYPRSRWEELWTQLLGAMTYTLNRVLAAESVDYYAGGGVTSSPVQHMWSLAVQGQVFLLWPVLILGALLLSRALRRSFRTTAIAVFAVVLVVSLTASILQTPIEPAAAYFSTGLRLWEFALGSLAALIFTSALPWRAALAVGWAGLTAVLLTAFAVGPTGLFPGWVALMPTLGAAALLIARDSGGSVGAHTVLENRVLRWLGDRSYGIYLWHWPLMITWLLLTGAPSVSLISGLTIIAAAILLSLLTERAVALVTAQRRAEARPSTRRELVRLAAIVLAVVLPVSAAQSWTASQSALAASAEITPANYPGAAAALDGFDDGGLPDLPPIPRWSELEHEWGVPGDACTPEQRPDGFDELAECYVQQPSGKPSRTVVLLGDSHAKQLSAPLKGIAQDNDWRLISFIYPGCRYSGADSGTADPACADFNRAVEAAVLELDPEAVIAQGTRSQMPGQGPREALVPGWGQGMAAFQEQGIEVISVRDNPRWSRDMFECVDLYGKTSRLCGDPVDEALGGQAILDEWARTNPEIPLVDLTDLYCPDGYCGPTVGNVMVYRDLDHVTTTFGRSTAPMLEERLLAAMQD